MNFAIIKTGGKQYKVSTGDLLKIEKINPVKGPNGEKGVAPKVGDIITFNEVMLTDTVIGTPFVDGAVVTGTLEEIGRNKTVDVIKYKQKSRYFKSNGHRQPFFKVKIDSLS